MKCGMPNLTNTAKRTLGPQGLPTGPGHLHGPDWREYCSGTGGGKQGEPFKDWLVAEDVKGGRLRYQISRVNGQMTLNNAL